MKQCGKDCQRWIKSAKRCPKGAVSAAAAAENCSLYLPKEAANG